MKTLSVLLCCSSAVLAFCCSCSVDGTNTSTQIKSGAPATSSVGQTNNAPLGTWIILTNANVVMWVPASVVSVWDGPTTSIEAERITPTRALPQEYKILVEIQIDSEQEFKKDADMSQNWVFQDHPTLSTRDGNSSRQFRKDIRDPNRSRILLINGMVDKSDTFDKDVETAKKMIESIKLIER